MWKSRSQSVHPSGCEPPCGADFTPVKSNWNWVYWVDVVVHTVHRSSFMTGNCELLLHINTDFRLDPSCCSSSTPSVAAQTFSTQWNLSWNLSCCKRFGADRSISLDHTLWYQSGATVCSAHSSRMQLPSSPSHTGISGGGEAESTTGTITLVCQGRTKTLRKSGFKFNLWK